MASFPFAGFQSENEGSDEEECSSSNQNKAHVESVSAKKRSSRTIKPRVPYSPEKSSTRVVNRGLKQKIEEKKLLKTSKNSEVVTKSIPENRKTETTIKNSSPVPWTDRTVIPIAPFDKTRTNGITPKDEEINELMEKIGTWAKEAQKEKKEAIKDEVLAFSAGEIEVLDCFKLEICLDIRDKNKKNSPAPTSSDENVVARNSTDASADDGENRDKENRKTKPKSSEVQVDADSTEELGSEYDIDEKIKEEKKSDNDSHHPDRETDDAAELPVKSQSYALTHEVHPIKMNYFMPLGNSVCGKDETQLRNLPELYNRTDDIAVCSELSKVFSRGIRGYEPNAYEISDQLLFQIIKKALPKTTAADAELFYYALYRLFPNYGSQEEMSLVFPKLVKLLARDEAELTDYLSWETWKVGREKEYEEEEDNSIYWKHPCSKRNFFVKSIRLPSEDERDLCSDECYKYMNDDDSKNENQFIVDFCGVVSRFKNRTNRTCLEWFKFLLVVANNFEESETNKKRTYHDKWRSFDKVLKKVRNMGTVFAITPCCHFGPCGPGVDNCSCELFCSVYCQCDDDCVRRFPGCQCAPGQCRTTSCPCVAIGWECIEDSCSKCYDPSIKCQNSCATGIEDKEVRVGKSNIEGNGLFLDENVKKGDFLGVYVGELTEAETERRGIMAFFGNNYLYGLPNTTESIDSSRAGNLWRFANHAKVPNCSGTCSLVQGLPTIKFHALKAMKAGEELALSYGDQGSVKKFMHYSPLEDRLPKWNEKETVNHVKKVSIVNE
ncbi:hypothetical protein CAEBREN_29870 [Caenorhabditis brenneri]|uniref:Uncharacterized protein n=2 Tax=Caenorhabditis brenneri TaxID=135651 RepID=G0P976_CAEBE|nr:hypothetical protein CAEBREN_29870 [Caenorhabditis brenneri]